MHRAARSLSRVVVLAIALSTLLPIRVTADTGDAQPPRPPGVSLAGQAYHYSYRVDGVPQVIRGMGYNPMYRDLPADERAARYDRDFSAMQQAGVNTLIGWATDEFDQLLLDRAQQHGLGVILPYDLDPRLDYTDPALRASLADDALARVQRYKDHPAVRMWGLGNEILLKLVQPAWIKEPGDPLAEARGSAFVSFYVDLADRVHQTDPGHPVIYRDAEVAYLPRLREALNRDGVRRPWFVYGVNIYTPQLAEVVANWPREALDSALLISEFGPAGAGPNGRPRAYPRLWETVRSQPDYVLGGAPYVWFTDGPETVDRVFGLVDPSGRPVDGTLAAIGHMFRDDPPDQAFASTAEPALGACAEQVSAFARQTLQMLQTTPSQALAQSPTVPDVMGPLDNLPPDPVASEDLRFERSVDATRLTWLQQTGYQAEWWVTWNLRSRPGDQLGLLVRARDDQLGVAYIYHGPHLQASAGQPC